MKLDVRLIKRIICGLFFLPLTCFSASPDWKIVSNTSQLNFTATQNEAPVSGSFKTFTGDILFDPSQLNTSQVNIKITMDSVETSFPLIGMLLKAIDWFDTADFPLSYFKANKFHQTGPNHYSAMGTLTLRGKTAPVTVDFDWKNLSPKTAHVEGNALLQRSIFGVGQGEWAKTDEIKDNVKVNFVLDLTKK